MIWKGKRVTKSFVLDSANIRGLYIVPLTALDLEAALSEPECAQLFEVVSVVFRKTVLNCALNFIVSYESLLSHQDLFKLRIRDM